MTDPKLDDLATLVRRFVHSTRNDSNYSALREHAMGYLKRHGLTGNALKSSKPLTINANENSCYWRHEWIPLNTMGGNLVCAWCNREQPVHE